MNIADGDVGEICDKGLGLTNGEHNLKVQTTIHDTNIICVLLLYLTSLHLYFHLNYSLVSHDCVSI
jgi:hypothetical protein